jgi:hypothetical protein
VKNNNQLAREIGGKVGGSGGCGDGGGDCSCGGDGGKAGGGGEFGGKVGGEVSGEVGGNFSGNVTGVGGKGGGKDGGDGNSNKSNGNEGSGQAIATRAMATTWAMATAMRLAGNKKTREGCKGTHDGDVRVAGNEEGEGSKAMAMMMVTRMEGKWSVTATKRLMEMATRVAGEQQLRQQRVNGNSDKGGRQREGNGNGS